MKKRMWIKVRCYSELKRNARWLAKRRRHLDPEHGCDVSKLIRSLLRREIAAERKAIGLPDDEG
jgi:hypothetical protein